MSESGPAPGPGPEREKFSAPSQSELELTQVEHRTELVETLAGPAIMYEFEPSEAKPGASTVIIVPGYSEHPGLYRDSIAELLKAGRRVVTYEQAMDDKRFEPLEDQYSEGLRRAETLLGVLDHAAGDSEELHGFSLLAHSFGAKAALLVAAQWPELVAGVVLDSPQGFLSEDDLLHQAGRTAKHMTQGASEARRTRHSDPDRSARTKLWLQAGRQYMTEDAGRAAREGLEMAGAQPSYRLMQEVHELGVPVAIISHEEDKHFDADRLQTTMAGKQVTTFRYLDGSTGYIDGYYAAKGSHNSIYTEPEQYTALAENAITALETKPRRHPPHHGSFELEARDSDGKLEGN